MEKFIEITTREKLEQMCYEKGMFESQAKTVVDLAIPEIDNLDNYKITWDRPASEYPEPLYIIMFLTVKKVAYKWIEENFPLAWFKPMFA